ncbi:MAG: hypothetical protein JW832_13510 [Deltaproteobacteria bacterium]|nr:hypothetical protein [Deltaproteobacteria bacterium]
MHSKKSPPARVYDAVSIFLAPIKITSSQMKNLPPSGRELKIIDAIDRHPERRLPLIEYGQQRINIKLTPKLAYLSNIPWAALVIQADLIIDEPITFEQLLAFNVGFRQFRGNIKPQDSCFSINPSDFHAAVLGKAENKGVMKAPSALYQEYAELLFPQHKGISTFSFLPKLKKAVVVSYARFDQALNDRDLYRFGTVAYPGEPVDDQWAAGFEQNRFDRWAGANWRCFAHSYSLVFALGQTPEGIDRNDNDIKTTFCTDYMAMGASIAIQRAWLQELPETVRNSDDMRGIRACHEQMVMINSLFGLRWTSEGTQRMRIEQLWRRSTGIDDRLHETQKLLNQKIEVRETEAAEKLNNLVMALQIVLGGAAGAQIGLAAYDPKTWSYGLAGFLWALVILLLIWPLYKGYERLKKFITARSFRK